MRRGGHGVPLQAMADAAEQAGRPSAHRWQGVEADAGWRASSVTGGTEILQGDAREVLRGGESTT